MDDVKQKILAETKEQFLERGPGGTSLQSVLDATGLSESEFHENFASMEEVVWTLLQGYTQGEFAIMEKFKAQATELTENPTDQTLTFFKLFYEDFLAEWVAQHKVPPTGDLFSVFVYGRGAVSEKTYQHSAESLAKWVDIFAEIIQPLLDTAEQPLGEANAQELANMMVSINLGAIILGRAIDDKFILSRQERLFSDYMRRLISA